MDGKGERLLVVHNTGSTEIPPNCPMELLGIEGTAEPIHKVQAPSSASLSQILINNDSTLYSGSYAAVPDSWPRWASFSGATQPTIGGQVGVAAGTLGMVSGNTGFLCLALHGTATTAGTLALDGTDSNGAVQEGRALVRPFSSGATPALFWTTQTDNLVAMYSTGYALYPSGVRETLQDAVPFANQTGTVWYNREIVKSADSNYYLSVIPGNNNSPGKVYRSTSPSSGFSDINYPAVLQYGANKHVLAGPNGNVLVVSPAAYPGFTFAGTDLQIMEFHRAAGSSGTWGTSLLSTTVRGGQNFLTFTNAGHQLGPWHGRVVVQNARSHTGNAAPSTDKFPAYDGTTWSYVPVSVYTSGTDYRDSVYAASSGAIAGEAGSNTWAIGYYYSGYSDSSGTLGLLKHDGASWSVTPAGTFSFYGFYTTPIGGLLAWRSGLNAVGTASYSLQMFHCYAGSARAIGDALTSNAPLGNYGKRQDVRIATGNGWSGTRVGDVFLQIPIPSNVSVKTGGSSLLGGILRLPAIGGTAHGTWEQFSTYYRNNNNLWTEYSTMVS